MAYNPTTPRLGTQPIANSDTTQRHVLGTRIFASDPVYGEGEFIYLKGVASTVVGSVVTWDAAGSTPSYQTALNAATANAGQQLAVSMSVNLATGFGWYQLSGTAVVATNGTLAGAGVVYAIAGGTVTSSSTAGKAVNNMRALSATGTPAAGQAVAQLDHPFGEGVVA